MHLCKKNSQSIRNDERTKPNSATQGVGLATAVLSLYARTLKVLYRDVSPLAPTSSVANLALNNRETSIPVSDRDAGDSVSASASQSSGTSGPEPETSVQRYMGIQLWQNQLPRSWV